MSADLVHTCERCGSTRHCCHKCRKPFQSNPVRIPPPYGSLNTAAPVVVCESCHAELVRLVFAWIGAPIPPEYARVDQ